MLAKQRKIVVLGYRGVGKTSLVTRYVTGQFPDVYSPTIENNYATTIVTRKLREYRLQIVDTAGQDQLSHIPSMYAVNIDAYILVFSVQSADSFSVVQTIYNRLLSTTGLLTGRFPIVLVANKTDLRPSHQSQLDTSSWLFGARRNSSGSSPTFSSHGNEATLPRVVSSEEGRRLAATWQAAYVETSALDSVNVGEVFEMTAERLKEADDGWYLMSSIGLNKSSSWSRRKSKDVGKHSNHHRTGDTWWRKLTCTSSSAVAESNL